MRSQAIYSFAKPEILIRFMTEINLPLELKTSVCSDLCNFINQFITNDKNKLHQDIQIENSYPINDEIFSECLRATKNYLASRDFNFPNKYQTKSWLWGEVTSTSETPLLKLLYRTLDIAIENLAATSETSYSQAIYQILKSASQYVLQHPMQALIAGLILQASVGKAEENRNKDQCALRNVHVTFAPSFPNTCSYVEGIPYQYHVIEKNVPFDQVRYFVLMETHDNLNHHQLKKPFIQNMGTGQDFILLEGMSALSSTACEDIYITKEFKISLGYEKNSFSLGLAKENYCFGWDDVEIVKKAKDSLSNSYLIIDEYFKKIQNSIQELMNLTSENLNRSNMNLNNLDKQKVSNILTSIFSDIDFINKDLKKNMQPFNMAEINKIYQVFKKSYDLLSLMEIIKHISLQLQSVSQDYHKNVNSLFSDKSLEKIIKDRNKSLINTLKVLPSLNLIKTQHKFFIFAGAEHIVPRRILNKKTNWQDIKSNDLQYELRESLKDKPYAILYPKR